MPEIKHTGTRKLIREDLNEDLYFRPRHYVFTHPVGYYLDETRAKRPVRALHMLARFSEEMLFRTRHGPPKCRRAFREATLFFNEVRQAERTFISDSHVGSRLRRNAALSRRVVKLQAGARAVYEAVQG